MNCLVDRKGCSYSPADFGIGKMPTIKQTAEGDARRAKAANDKKRPKEETTTSKSVATRRKRKAKEVLVIDDSPMDSGASATVAKGISKLESSLVATPGITESLVFNSIGQVLSVAFEPLRPLVESPAMESESSPELRDLRARIAAMVN